MAWTAPMTAIAGSVFTAAQWNTYIRDNLMETEVGRAQTVSGYLVSSGYNQLSERTAQTAFPNSTVTTTETSYADPEEAPGPAITAITDTHAIVGVYGAGRTTGGTAAWISYAVEGASSIEPSDGFAVQFHTVTNDSWRGSAVNMITGLTPGSNTFTVKYRVSTSGTGTFSSVRLTVIPF